MDDLSKNVRLSPATIKTIKDTVFQFDPNAEIILFGSRTELNKQGGDIDLLILSKKITYQDKRKISLALFNALGDRKIDLIVSSDYNASEFTKMAFNNGVKL